MKRHTFLTSICLIAALAWMVACAPAPTGVPATESESAAADPLVQPISSDPLIAGFQKSTVASVCDAVDKVCGKKGYMAYDMRPWIGKAFVGRAVTALVKFLGGRVPAAEAAFLRYLLGLVFQHPVNRDATSFVLA